MHICIHNPIYRVLTLSYCYWVTPSQKKNKAPIWNASASSRPLFEVPSDGRRRYLSSRLGSQQCKRDKSSKLRSVHGQWSCSKLLIKYKSFGIHAVGHLLKIYHHWTACVHALAPKCPGWTMISSPGEVTMTSPQCQEPGVNNHEISILPYFPMRWDAQICSQTFVIALDAESIDDIIAKHKLLCIFGICPSWHLRDFLIFLDLLQGWIPEVATTSTSG